MPSLVQDVKAPPERIIRSAKNVTSPVVHLILREGLSSVFEAMVVAPVAKLRERGLDTRLVVFAPIGELFRTNLRRRWRSRMDSINQIYNRPVHRLPSPPARMPRLWSEARILKKWLMSHIGTNKPAILHCRGPEATGLALQVRQEMPQLKVIFDMRGLVDAEYLYDREFTPADLLPANVDAEYHRLKQMQQIALHSADAIFCVSHAMADHAILRLGARAEDVTVLPCAVAKTDREAGDNRRPIRQRLGIEDNFVVAFSGGTQRWQMPRQSVKVFQHIKELRPDAHFLVLTLDVDRMRNELEAAGLRQDDTTLLCVPHSQVSQHLAAADLGLLLRDQSLVNTVASPVKFAEYLACGVPVVISDGLGDFSQLVRQRQVGVVLPMDSDDALLLQILGQFLNSYDHDDLAERCREIVRGELNLERNVERTMWVYEQLCDSSCESCT